MYFQKLQDLQYSFMPMGVYYTMLVIYAINSPGKKKNFPSTISVKTLHFFLILRKLALDLQLLNIYVWSLFKAIKKPVILQSSSVSQTRHIMK